MDDESPKLIAHRKALDEWRSKSTSDQLAYFQSSGDPSSLALVAACPERGSELPVSAYPEGCCNGPTRHECRRGKGSEPGRPTTADCLDCVRSRTP